MEDREEIDSHLSFNNFLSRKKAHNEKLIISKRELDLYYKIADSTSRRKCLILNYKSFTSHGLVKRTWSDLDVHLLQSTFEQLKFTVHLYEDLSYNKTISLIQTESKRADNKDVDCFVLIILSHHVELHQGKLEFYCTDKSLRVELAVDQLTKPAATLAGKPKLIFIEAANYSAKNDQSEDTLTHDSASPAETNCRQYLIPRFSDCLITYLSSNVVNQSVFEKNGSESIRLLCDILRNFSHEADLMTLLTLLADAIQRANEVSHSKQAGATALVQTMSTLTRLVHFGPHSL